VSSTESKKQKRVFRGRLSRSQSHQSRTHSLTHSQSLSVVVTDSLTDSEPRKQASSPSALSLTQSVVDVEPPQSVNDATDATVKLRIWEFGNLGICERERFMNFENFVDEEVEMGD